MKNTRNILGENIRRIRKELGWTQTDLAVESGISFRGVNEIETGKRSPRTDTLAAIAGALKVPESILYSKELPSNFKVQDIPNDTLKLITEMSVKAAKDLDSKNTLSNEEQELLDIIRGVTDKDRRRVIVDTARRLANVKNRQATVRRMKAR